VFTNRLTIKKIVVDVANLFRIFNIIAQSLGIITIPRS